MGVSCGRRRRWAWLRTASDELTESSKSPDAGSETFRAIPDDTVQTALVTEELEDRML